MEVHLIAAIAPHGIIGNNGTLPWSIPEDLKHFKTLTSGYPVIMGRKTFESLNMPEGLPNRYNIVVSTRADKTKCSKNVMWVNKLSTAIVVAMLQESQPDKAFIIGGATIYEEALRSGYVNVLDISYVKKEYPGDTKFPLFNRMDWVEDDMHDYAEFRYIRFIRK